jgi:lysophospholipase L1-like esterase
MAFAEHWRQHNERILAATGGRDDGPLWVVLGDSTAQGLGAPNPDGGYVGQALLALEARTGQRWRVLNLSVSGALIRDVLGSQVPALPGGADLVTCGIGANDILYSAPSKLFGDLRALLASIPANTVMLDLPIPQGFWGIIGRASVPYVNRINRVIHEVAAERGLPVAEVSAHFTPPWKGKFAVDSFHPSVDGYRDWTRALLAAIPSPVPAV